MVLIKVFNPHKLPTIKYNLLGDFQGDFKHACSNKQLVKLKNSLIKHGVFVPKFVWFDGDNANILDGHQTKIALAELEQDGFDIPEIPYISVEATNKEDAVAKLLQLNSKYGTLNPNTKWLNEFNFNYDEIIDLWQTIEVPEINIDNILNPISFDFADKPNTVASAPTNTTPASVDWSNIPPSVDSVMKPTPLDRFTDTNNAVESGRYVLIYKDELQKQWLINKIGLHGSDNQVLYTVSDLTKGEF